LFAGFTYGQTLRAGERIGLHAISPVLNPVYSTDKLRRLLLNKIDFGFLLT